jgi:hypothetical protein
MIMTFMVALRCAAEAETRNITPSAWSFVVFGTAWVLSSPYRTCGARAAAMAAMCQAAFAADVRAAKEMREAIEGKAPQRIEIATRPRTEVTIRVAHDRKLVKDGDTSAFTLQGAAADRVLVRGPGLAS